MEAETGKSFDEVLIEHGEMLKNDIKSLSDSLESKPELRFSNQLKQVGKFKGCNAQRLKKSGETCNKIVDVGHVCKHIVGDS